MATYFDANLLWLLKAESFSHSFTQFKGVLSTRLLDKISCLIGRIHKQNLIANLYTFIRFLLFPPKKNVIFVLKNKWQKDQNCLKLVLAEQKRTIKDQEYEHY